MLLNAILVGASLSTVSCGYVHSSVANGKNEDGPQRRFHLGNPDFSQVVTTAGFVDKSLLIKEFFERRMLLVRAPLGFGKTTNMDMIKRFAEIVVDGDGKPIQNVDKGSDSIGKLGDFEGAAAVDLTDNYKIFKELKIHQDKAFFRRNFGQYPVIHVDFEQLEGGKFDRFLNSFRRVLHASYRLHGKLLDAKDLWYDDGCVAGKFSRKRFAAFFDEAEYKKLDEPDLDRGLLDLAELLHLRYENKPIVLIDDYDTLIFKGFQTPDSEVDKIYKFIGKVLSELLKDNENVDRALINSCLGFADVFLREVSSLEHIPFLSDRYVAPFYGLTETEVAGLATKFGVVDKMDEIRMWYGGYEGACGDNLYSVRSVLGYLEAGVFKSYWVESSGTADLGSLFSHDKIRSKILRLLNNQTVETEATDRMSIEQLTALRKIVIFRERIVYGDCSDLFVRYLRDSGYFSAVAGKADDDVFKRFGTVNVSIPNREIHSELTGKLRKESS